MPVNPATPSTEPRTETEKTPTETIPEESDTRIASGPSSEMRVVGKFRSVVARNVWRIQA